MRQEGACTFFGGGLRSLLLGTVINYQEYLLQNGQADKYHNYKKHEFSETYRYFLPLYFN